MPRNNQEPVPACSSANANVAKPNSRPRLAIIIPACMYLRRLVPIPNGYCKSVSCREYYGKDDDDNGCENEGDACGGEAGDREHALD